MYRTTSTEVALRRSELLREAENRRLASTVRRRESRPSRVARVIGLLTATSA